MTSFPMKGIKVHNIRIFLIASFIRTLWILTLFGVRANKGEKSSSCTHGPFKTFICIISNQEIKYKLTTNYHGYNLFIYLMLNV